MSAAVRPRSPGGTFEAQPTVCHPDRKHKGNGLCTPCYRELNPPAGAAQMRAWRAAHPEATVEARRRSHLRFNFGLSEAEYAALLERQGGVCAICQHPERTRAADGRVRRLAVDHDHATGAIRGLLCNPCNRGLGYFLDDRELLDRAFAYLSQSHMEV